MQRSVLHSLVAVAAAAVLLLQHAPLAIVGGHGHKHCSHCTERYCTKSGEPCAHHRSPSSNAPRGDDAHESGHSHADRGGAHTNSQDLYAGVRADRHSHGTHRRSDNGPAGEHEHQSDVDAADAFGAEQAVATTIRPCDVPPSGIISLTLDKFFAGSSDRSTPSLMERSSSARYLPAADQNVPDAIFRPPVS